MAAPPPIPLSPLKKFQDQASKIVAKHDGLNALCRMQLYDLGRDLGLSHQQWEEALETLKKPPAEGEPAAETPPPPPPKSSPASPPPKSSPASPPPIPADAVAPAQPPPPPVAAPPPVATAPSVDDRLSQFAEQAALLLSQHGASPRAQAMIEAAGRKLGLSPPQVEQALDRLQAAPSAPEPPPPAAASPRQVFVQFLHEALEKAAKESLNVRKEEKLIAEGVQKLGLSPVLARQLLHDTAAERGLRLVSREQEQARQAAEKAELQHPNSEEFRQRAASILLEHRDSPARRTAMLDTVAEELGLSEPQAKRLLESMQSGGDGEADPEKQRLQQRLGAFEEYLQQTLPKFRQAVLGRAAEQKLLEAADARFGVPPNQARSLLHRIAAELKMQRITSEQAAEHLSELIADWMGESVWVDPDVNRRIFAEGRQWGLDEPQIEALIREQLRANRRRRESDRSVTGLALASSVGVGCALAAFFAWLFFWRRDAPVEPPVDPVAEVQTNQPINPQTRAIDRPTGQEWWAKNANLLAAVTSVRVQVPELKKSLLALQTTDPQTRAQDYGQVISEAADLADSPERQTILQELLACCYGADPEDDAAAGIRRALLALIPRVGDPLPDDQEELEKTFWAVQTIAATLQHPEVSNERAAPLADELSAALGGVVLDRQQPPDAVARICLIALCRRLDRVLIAAADQQPEQAGELFRKISALLGRLLPAAERRQRVVEFLEAVLPASGDNWKRYEDLLQQLAFSSDTLTLLRLVEIYEDAQSRDLQRRIMLMLLSRRELSGVSFEPGETVAEQVAKMRRALGAQEHATGDERLRQLRREAGKTLASAGASREDMTAFLQEMLDFAHHSSRACALDQGDPGHASFDTLTNQPPAKLSVLNSPTSKSPISVRRDTALKSMQEAVEASARRLVAPNTPDPLRFNSLRGITTYAEQLQDVSPEAARSLARYLLALKGENQHQAVLGVLAEVVRWPQVRLEIADQLEQVRKREHREQAKTTIEAVLQRTLPNDDDWRETARRELLRGVLGSLASAAAADSSDTLYNDASAGLASAYRTQARLRGVDAQAYNAATTPGQTLKLLVQAEAPRLEQQKLSQEAQTFLRQLPHELAVADYLGKNDLMRTAFYQRIWLQLLAIHVEKERPEAAEEAKKLIRNLQEDDAQAQHVLDQLRHGEEMLLKMWLLKLADKS